MLVSAGVRISTAKRRSRYHTRCTVAAQPPPPLEDLHIGIEVDEAEAVYGHDMDSAFDVDNGAREHLGIHNGSHAWVFKQAGFDHSVLAGCKEKGSGPKKMLALVIGYNGARYCGLQQISDGLQRFLPTIESELELALYRAGAILPTNFGNLKRLHWSRVGRTDAGVSAACSVVAGRLLLEGDSQEAVNELVRRTRLFLPPDVVLHSATTVTRRFDARGNGSSRGYLYLLPSYCVVPTLDAVRSALQDMGIDSMEKLDLARRRDLEEAAGLHRVRIQPAHLELFRRALHCFKGNRFFGNFANARIQSSDPEGWRYMKVVDCGDPFLDDGGREWLPITVMANSFITHQIRKMLATAAQVAQGFLPFEFIAAALERSLKCKTPRLPPDGLIFLRPWFHKGSRCDPLVAALDSPALLEAIEAYCKELKRIVVERDAQNCRWAYWLACVAHFDKPMQRGAQDAVRAHAALLQRVGPRQQLCKESYLLLVRREQDAVQRAHAEAVERRGLL